MRIGRIKTKYIDIQDAIIKQTGIYGDGSPCLRLVDEADTTAPYAATITVRIEGNDLPENHVWIKGWSENVGLPDQLELSGCFIPTDVLMMVGGHNATTRLYQMSHELVESIHRGEH